MKIYIAGHRGLVGSAIYQKLLSKNYEDIIFKTKKELDLRKQDETDEFFDKNKPNFVYLAAGKVGGILANNTYKAEFIYDNLAITMNVINASFKSGVKKLLNLGSSCIYPKFAPQPMKEEYLLTSELESTNEPYAIAKIAAIKLCRYYNEQYGTNFISVMPTNLYGSNDNFNLETSHVLPALIRKCHLAKLLSKRDFNSIIFDIRKYPLGFGFDNKINYEDENSIEVALNNIGIFKDYLVVWGSGEVYREFLHVDDMCDACVYLMENIDARDIKKLCPDYFVNVGTGEDIKLNDLVSLIQKIVGFGGEIRHDPTKPDGTPRKLLDVSEIRSLGWKYKIQLRDGITRLYESYLV